MPWLGKVKILKKVPRPEDIFKQTGQKNKIKEGREKTKSNIMLAFNYSFLRM